MSFWYRLVSDYDLTYGPQLPNTFLFTYDFICVCNIVNNKIYHWLTGTFGIWKGGGGPGGGEDIFFLENLNFENVIVQAHLS